MDVRFCPLCGHELSTAEEFSEFAKLGVGVMYCSECRRYVLIHGSTIHLCSCRSEVQLRLLQILTKLERELRKALEKGGATPLITWVRTIRELT